MIQTFLLISVWLIPDPTAGATPFIEPVWVFLAPSRLARKAKVFRYWISLDSLVRINRYQRVTRDFQSMIFPRALVVAKQPPKRRPHDSACERTDCSWAKLTLISGFLQGIAVLLSGPPPSNSKSLWANVSQSLSARRPAAVARPGRPTESLCFPNR
jgi:hypothetical protein